MTGKAHKLEQAKRLLLTAPQGMTDQELAQALDVDRMTAYRYRVQLGATTLLVRGRYTLYPNQDDVTLAQTVLEKAAQTSHVQPATLSAPTDKKSESDTLVQLQERNRRMYTISICNEKGGTCKTTLSIHLGAGLALRGLQVLIIDMDTQGHATIGLGATKAPKLYDLLVRDADWKDVITAIPPTVFSQANTDPETIGGLYLLPGHVETRNIPATLPANALRSRLESLQGIIDLVIIDNAPTATLLSTTTYLASDAVLLPSIMEAWSLDGLKETFRRVRDSTPDRARVGLPELQTLGIIPAMYRDNSEHKDNLKDLRAKYQELVWPEFRQRVIWSIAARHRHTIFAHDTNTADLTKARTEIWTLIDRMEKELPHVPTA
ncbi:MAG: AAA family ATPase [Aggregatilineales bacterium]